MRQRHEIPRHEVGEMAEPCGSRGAVLGERILGFVPQFLRQWRIGRLRARLAAFFRKPPVAANNRILAQRPVVGDHGRIAFGEALVLFAELGQRRQCGVVVLDEIMHQTRLALGLDEQQVGERAGGGLVADEVIPAFRGDQMAGQEAQRIAGHAFSPLPVLGQAEGGQGFVAIAGGDEVVAGGGAVGEPVAKGAVERPDGRVVAIARHGEQRSQAIQATLEVSVRRNAAQALEETQFEGFEGGQHRLEQRGDRHFVIRQVRAELAAKELLINVDETAREFVKAVETQVFNGINHIAHREEHALVPLQDGLHLSCRDARQVGFQKQP